MYDDFSYNDEIYDDYEEYDYDWYPDYRYDWQNRTYTYDPTALFPMQSEIEQTIQQILADERRSNPM